MSKKIGRRIVSEDVMDRECNCSLPSKVNGNCVYKGKCQNKILIYKVKSSICDAIYIGNTQQKLKKIMNRHFSDLLRLLKNRKKPDSFAARFKHHSNNTTSCTNLRKYMMFKVVKHPKPIGSMKTFIKSNWNVCMEECLTVFKNLCYKRVTFMNNNLLIYRACQNKTTTYIFFLRTDDTVFIRWKS